MYLRNIAVFAGVAACSYFAHGTTIDFEGYPPSNFNQGDYFESVYEDGFVLSRVASAWLINVNNQHIPNSGSVALLVEGGNNATVHLSAQSGGPFSVSSFRASEGRNIQGGLFPDYGSSRLTVIGHFADGSTISTDFELDLLAGENSGTDFQTLTLSGYSNLTGLDFIGQGTPVGPRSYADGHSFGIDDIEVLSGSSSIPEPSTLLLLVVTGLGMLASRTSRSRQTALQVEYRRIAA